MHRIFVGFRCNNGCVFCAQEDDRAASVVTSAANVAAVEAQIAAMRIEEDRTAAFVGGEPTAHAELPAWIARAVERGATRVVVQTNGRRLAYASYVRELADASAGATAATGGALSFDVSLHGATREMHEHLTRTPGSFAQTIHGLRNARAAKIPSVVTTVMTRANYRHLAEMVRLVRALDVAALRFVAVDPRPVPTPMAPLSPPAAMLAPRIAAARELASHLGLPLYVGALPVNEERFAGGSVTLDRA